MRQRREGVELDLGLEEAQPAAGLEEQEAQPGMRLMMMIPNASVILNRVANAATKLIPVHPRSELEGERSTCPMGANRWTLAIPETTAAIMAHEFALGVYENRTFLADAKTNGLSFLNFIIDAVCTPFAAFYIDLDPTGITHTTLRHSITMAIRSEIAMTLQVEGLKHWEEIAEELCSRPNGYNGSMDSASSGSGFRGSGSRGSEYITDIVSLRTTTNMIIDEAMQKITDQLAETRAKWTKHALTLAQVRVYEITPARETTSAVPSLPTLEIIDFRLPIDVVPRAGMHKNHDASTISKPYRPAGVELHNINYHCGISTIDAVKYALTNALTTIPAPATTPLMAFPNTMTDRTFTVHIVRVKKEQPM